MLFSGDVSVDYPPHNGGHNMPRSVSSVFWLSLLVAVLLTPLAVWSEDSPPEQAAIALYRDGRLDEAITAFDELSRKSPSDDSLKIWWSLATLEKAYSMRLDKTSGSDVLAVRAYTILKPMYRSQWQNADWYYAMAKAYFLNGRPRKAIKAIEKGLYYRLEFPEAYILLGDIGYDRGMSAPSAPSLDESNPSSSLEPTKEGAIEAEKNYMVALKMPGLRPDVAAEADFKMGRLEMDLRNKSASAREWWEKAVAVAPQSRYGKLARTKLGPGWEK